MLGGGQIPLLKNSLDARQSPSAAKASTERKPFIAAVNRCATQKQGQRQIQTDLLRSNEGEQMKGSNR
jgi:hypothetical protein